MLTLKMESYGPVLKMLGERSSPASEAVVWTLVVLVAVPLLLLLANRLRRWMRRRRVQALGYERLDRVGHEKGLTYPEQVALERMAGAAGLQNPTQMLTSIAVFNQAVAAWMQKVEQMPWLEMEEQVERLGAIRKKLGFRYLPADRLPTGTRELVIGQKLYILAGTSKGLRLLSTNVVHLDDLAIYTEPFSAKQPVRLKKNQDAWVFFWSESGAEYRFKTRVLKAVERPAPYLMLRHADGLVHDDGRKTISCDLELEILVDWLPAGKTENAAPSPKLFDRFEAEVESLPAELLELSGSGFTLSADDVRIEIGDLVRFKSHEGLPGVLEDQVGRAVKETSRGVCFKFLNLSPEQRHALLKYITPRMSAELYRKKTGEKSLASG